MHARMPYTWCPRLRAHASPHARRDTCLRVGCRPLLVVRRGSPCARKPRDGRRAWRAAGIGSRHAPCRGHKTAPGLAGAALVFARGSRVLEEPAGVLEEPTAVEGQRGLGGARPATGRRRVAPPWRCTPPLAPFAAPAHAGKLQWFEMQARKAFNDLFKAFVPYCTGVKNSYQMEGTGTEPNLLPGPSAKWGIF